MSINAKNLQEAGAVMVVKPEHGEFEVVRSEFTWLQG